MQIHHVGYLTKRISETEKEFIGLGWTIERPVKQDTIRQINIEFLVNGDYRVELVEPTSHDSPMYPLLSRYKNTPYHFCYETRSFDKDISDLVEKRGYMEIQAPEIAPCIDNARVCFLFKPSIGIIELVEMQ